MSFKARIAIEHRQFYIRLSHIIRSVSQRGAKITVIRRYFQRGASRLCNGAFVREKFHVRNLKTMKNSKRSGIFSPFRMGKELWMASVER
jgi:hypothetical protein